MVHPNGRRCPRYRLPSQRAWYTCLCLGDQVMVSPGRMGLSHPQQVPARDACIRFGCDKPIKPGDTITWSAKHRQAYHAACDGGLYRGHLRELSMDRYGNDLAYEE